jgi:hypothetical protein
MSRQWGSYAFFAHASKMPFDGFFDSPKGNVDALSGRYTSGKVRD